MGPTARSDSGVWQQGLTVWDLSFCVVQQRYLVGPTWGADDGSQPGSQLSGVRGGVSFFAVITTPVVMMCMWIAVWMKVAPMEQAYYRRVRRLQTKSQPVKSEWDGMG